MLFLGYLAVQNGAQHVGLVDLLAGGENHLHAVVVAQSAAMEEVHSTQLLHTNQQAREKQLFNQQLQNKVSSTTVSSK